jgi:hypothetical protein
MPATTHKTTEKSYSIDEIPSDLFDWSTWRTGSPADLCLQCQETFLTSPHGKSIIRQHAVGWCHGTILPCRPKQDHVGVMFFKNDLHFWFHLSQKEFDLIFGE